jgi:hypothetical protein
MRKRRCPKIQLCPTCGEMRGNHPRGLYECPVPEAVIAALRAFRDKHGPRWKAKLCELWMQGEDADDTLLRQARNMIGPRRLYKLAL